MINVIERDSDWEENRQDSPERTGKSSLHDFFKPGREKIYAGAMTISEERCFQGLTTLKANKFCLMVVRILAL